MRIRLLLGFYWIFFLCSTFSVESMAQEGSMLRGKVLHDKTDEPIPFAHVYWSGHESQGVVSDILGEFQLKWESSADTLVISHVGYVKLKLAKNQLRSDGRIFMESKQVELKEFLFLAGENPAFPLLRKAIANKKINDPSNLKSYRYESYDKMIFTVDGISEDGIRRTRFDTLFDGGQIGRAHV